MALQVKYNVYFSTDPAGPWALANTTPIDHIDGGNQYTVTGLKKDVVYYFLIVGGYMEGEEFIPLVSQHIGPEGSKVSALGTNPLPHVYAKVFTPHIPADTALGQKYEIPNITRTSQLGYKFQVKSVVLANFEGTAAWDENEWPRDIIGPEDKLTFIPVDFTASITTEDFEFGWP